MSGSGDRLPRWFLVLPLLAIAAWWPWHPYWASDDFLALHYAQDLDRALHDFVGPQYGAADTWLFFRPLVTMSWWLDAQLAGADPWLAHLSNVAAHGISALLVGLLWMRLLSPGAAFAAGLWWALLPSHAGVVLWAVGRTDGLATPLLLASLLLLLRWQEGRQRSRAPALLCGFLALCCKEVAFALLPLALLLPALLPLPDGRAASRWQRLGEGCRVGWPMLLLGLLVFAFRYWALGRIGGYTDASSAPWPVLRGFAHTTADLLVPLRWTAVERLSPALQGAAALLPYAGVVPIAIAAAVWLRRSPGLLGGASLLFAVACAPMVGLLAGYDLPFNLRNYYLPTVALAGLIAGAGPITAVLALLAIALPLVAVRLDVHQADRDDARLHRAILRELADRPPMPLFVAGLPADNGRGTMVQLHYGVDRMLEPPFGPGHARLLPLRPAADVPLALRLGGFESVADPVPYALPAGTTMFFLGPDLLGRAPAQPRPDLPVNFDGGTDCSFDQLLALVPADGAPAQQRVLRTRGVSPVAYRITVFTAIGYFSVLLQNRTPTAGSGEVSLRDLLSSGRFAGPGPLARLADPSTAGKEPADSALLDGLSVATTHDLATDFPVLVEAVEFAGSEVHVTHRARAMVVLQFDRQLPRFVRLIKGQ